MMAIELKRIEAIHDNDLPILGRMLDASFATNFADCPDDEKDMHKDVVLSEEEIRMMDELLDQMVISIYGQNVR